MLIHVRKSNNTDGHGTSWHRREKVGGIRSYEPALVMTDKYKMLGLSIVIVKRTYSLP
jgi:hypothetical protein